jgi:phosphoribosyl 1,2-cyclic phosphate phosphodiesterase
MTEIVLLGSGDMRSIPQPGCNCRNCILAQNYLYRRERRTNFGILICHNNRRTLIDVGPMLYNQLLNYYNSFLSFKDIDNILLTHDHYDHTGGLPFFYGNVKSKGECYKLFCLEDTFKEMKNRYSWIFREKKWKLFEYKKVFLFQRFEIDGLEILAIPMVHRIPTAGYVINFQSSENIKKKIVVVTDTKEIKEKYKKFLLGADLLFIGGVCEEDKFPFLIKGFFPDRPFEKVFRREKVGHFTIEQAKEISRNLEAKIAVGVHITHGNDTHNGLSKRFNDSHFKIGYDGMKFRF